MKKLIVLLGALMLLGLGASFGQTAMDPTSPYDHTIGRKVLTLQRWALAVDQAFEDGYVTSTGLAITNVLPPMPLFGGGKANREKKKETVLTKLTGFFNKFFNV